MTDPGLSAPPCPQLLFLDPPALLSPHNRAEPSARHSPQQSVAPLPGAPGSAAGRAGLSKRGWGPGTLPAMVLSWALQQPPAWGVPVGSVYTAAPSVHGAPGPWPSTFEGCVNCAKLPTWATQTSPRMLPTLLPLPCVKMLPGQTQAEKHLHCSASRHRRSRLGELSLVQGSRTDRQGWAQVPDGRQGQGALQSQQAPSPSSGAVRSPKHWPASHWQIHSIFSFLQKP